MLNLNFDVLNVEQTLFEKQAQQIANKIDQSEVSSKEKETQNSEKNNEAVKLKLSQVVLGKLNETLSKEDSLAQDLNSARTIYDSLSNVRIEIAGLLKELKNTNSAEQTLEGLEELDAKSNALIEKAISTVKQNDTKGLVDSSFLNLIFDGLNGLKDLKLNDKNYLTKIDGILEKINAQQNAYQNVNEELYSKLSKISKDYEKIVAEKNENKKLEADTNSNTIQKEIIQNFDKTLLATASKLTPEAVRRLLNP